MDPARLAPRRRDLLLISGAAVAWGAGGAAAAVLFRLSGLGPLAVSFWRTAVATLVLALALALAVALVGRDDRPRPGTPVRTAVLLGVGLAGYQSAYFASVDRAGLALGTLVTLGAGPLLVALGGRLLLGERPGRRGVAALAVALVGLVLLVGGSVSAGPGVASGVGAALLSALGYSAVTLYGRSAGGGGATMVSFVAGTVALLPLAVAEGVWPRTGDPLPVLGWLLFLGVVPTLLAYRWYFAGLATVPAATAAVLVLLEPVTAAVLAVVLFGERPTGYVAAGAALLLTAVTLLSRPVPRRPDAAATAT
ncbi:DMT family transporter [Micromonospora sp. NPDC092111]|uniref:DMT family transporter n=1 Tax=Micromonospora sp. NPDC092111 TaxID=3364289 RepID=UPI003806CD63